MNTSTKLIKSEMQNNSKMTIAHIASSTPFFYVEEVQIDGRKVSVSFFDENNPASETQTVKIPVKDLITFIDETYGDYINTGYSEDRILDTKSPFDYLCDNINQVTGEYLNAKGVPSHD